MNDDRADKLDWALIPSFLAVLDGGSLSAAARRLALQQPTVGRHIVALELQLGGELFERSRQGLRPTALAQRVEGSARAMAACRLRPTILRCALITSPLMCA